MREHEDPIIARRVWRNAIIGVVAVFVLVFFGIKTKGPAESLPWTPRVAYVLFTLYFVPAFYLTLRFKYSCPVILCVLGAFAGPAAVAWFWCFRWIPLPEMDTQELWLKWLTPAGLSAAAVGFLGCWGTMKFFFEDDPRRKELWSANVFAAIVASLAGAGTGFYHAYKGKSSLLDRGENAPIVGILLGGVLIGMTTGIIGYVKGRGKRF